MEPMDILAVIFTIAAIIVMAFVTELRIAGRLYTRLEVAFTLFLAAFLCAGTTPLDHLVNW